MNSSEYCLVLSTFPEGEGAAAAARELVERGLAACGNILPGLRSIYIWQGRQEESTEQLLILKTRCDIYPAVEEALRALHPYELPEIRAVPVQAGLATYLAWVDQGVRR